MRYETPSRETTFGYLSALESAEHGYFGGYLIVSPFGRPLEFHCTCPVRPSRAQEILYGPTLKPYLLGEQISSALLEAGKLTPQLIVTDQPAMLAAGARAAIPMVLLLANPEGGALVAQAKMTGSHCDASTVGRGLQLDGYELQLPAGRDSDEENITRSLKLLMQRVELAEPFERIHEAIREAQRIGQRNAETHGQAA